MRDESLQFLKDLVNAPSPSGYEEPAAKVYREYMGQFADKVETDYHGNVHAILNPDAEIRIMLAGHMDEIGFQVKHINDSGLLYFGAIGGHDRSVPLGQRVWVHGKERVPGIIGRVPIHLIESKDRSRAPEIHDLWIDIGASSREEAEKVISLGDPVTYQWEFQELMGGRAAARGFDNRCGSWSVGEALRLLKEDGGLNKKVGVWAVATVQEEIGLRGARTAAYDINAVTGLAIDVNFAIDTPGLSKERYGDIELGKGPTVARGANVNPVVFELIQKAAKKQKINIQVDPEPRGTGTDANAMQIARGAQATGLIGVPLRYMHCPGEMLALSDLEDCANLMAGYCRQVTPKTEFRPGH